MKEILLNMMKWNPKRKTAIFGGESKTSETGRESG
jgi:hypothetical protein